MPIVHLSKYDIAETVASAGQSVTTAASAIVIPASANPAAGQAVQQVMITAFAFPVNFTTDGTTPTATVGHQIATNGTVTVGGINDVKRLQFIGVGGTATLYISFLR